MSDHGQGKHTEEKERRRLSPIMGLIVGTMRNHPGHRFGGDFNGGSGWNDKVGCDGSPIVLMQHLAKAPQPSTLIAFETHTRRRIELQGRLSLEHRALANAALDFEVWADNSAPDTAARLIDRVPGSNLRGLIFADPDGPSGFAGDTIAELMSHHDWRGVDVLAHINCAPAKWARTVGLGTSPVAHQFSHWRDWSLSGLMAPIRKRHWWITEPIGHHQWVFLFGTNWRGFPGLDRYGFRLVNSQEGQEWLFTAQTTAAPRPMAS